MSAESELTFAKEIDALRYFVSAFNDFHQCAERIAIQLGFKPKGLQEELDTSGMGKLEDGVRQTLALWVENTLAGTTLEMGQLEDRRLYFQRRTPGADKTSAAKGGEALEG